MEDLCEYVNGNWSKETALQLAAYVMWRLNWIHPYPDGNGRTSRAASYLVLSVRSKFVLPQESTIPDQIAANKRECYAALEDADRAYAEGRIDLSKMIELLRGHLATQLLRVLERASGAEVAAPPSPPGPAWNND